MLNKLKQLDYSHKSFLRYIIDIHLAFILAIIVAYAVECIENEYVVILISMWSMYILFWTIYRAFDFQLKK